MRLDLAQLFLRQHPQSGQAVGIAALEQFLESWDFRFAGGDDDLAANFILQIVFAAELHHGGRSLDAKFRLQGSRLVVDARVNDAAIVPALVASHAVFFFDEQQPQMGKQPGAMHRGRETHDTSADNHDVESLIGHNSARRRIAVARFFIQRRAAESEVTAVILRYSKQTRCLSTIYPPTILTRSADSPLTDGESESLPEADSQRIR